MQGTRRFLSLPYSFLISIVFAFFASDIVIKSAYADSKTLYGLSFPYDQMQEVDSKNTRLVVDGKSHLLAHDAVIKTLVEASFENKSFVERASARGLIGFVTQSIEQKDLRFVVPAIRALYLNPQLNKEMLEDLFVVIENEPKGIEALKKVAEDKAVFSRLSPQLQIPTLFVIGVNDLAWLRERALSIVLAHKAEFSTYAKSYFSRTIKARKFAQLPQTSALLKETFGLEDKQFQETKLVADQIVQFEKSLGQRDISALEIVLVSLKGNEEIEPIVYPYIIEEIHRVAREELDAGELVRSLRLLSLVDLSYRTKTTHSLATLILGRLRENDLSVLSDSNIRSFLIALAQFDEGVKKAVEDSFCLQFDEALKKSNFTQADRALEGILLLRADPSAENDAMRIDYALILRRQGFRSQSDAQLAHVKTGVPLRLRLEMIAEDTVGTSVASFALQILGLLVAVLLIVNRVLKIQKSFNERQRARRDLEETRKEAEEFPMGRASDRPVFKRVDKVSPERSEYNHYLMLLGLSPSARFKEIRAAYRTAVKTHHPDMQGEEGGEVSDKFVDLNETYERILQLREIMGLEEDQ